MNQQLAQTIRRLAEVVNTNAELNRIHIDSLLEVLEEEFPGIQARFGLRVNYKMLLANFTTLFRLRRDGKGDALAAIAQVRKQIEWQRKTFIKNGAEDLFNQAKSEAEYIVREGVEKEGHSDE